MILVWLIGIPIVAFLSQHGQWNTAFIIGAVFSVVGAIAWLGVDAGPRDPLPVALVLRRVVVEELLREPALAEPPVDAQILNQKARRHHSQAVVHVPRAVELQHGGVD